MKVHPSALKRGVTAEDAVQAADWSQWVEPLEGEEWPHRELRLGFDTHARLLETVVLIFESGKEMVIHAMPARTVLGPAPLTLSRQTPHSGVRIMSPPVPYGRSTGLVASGVSRK